MTKPRITTYEELLQEKARLEALLQAQKEPVRQDIEEIKLELAPVQSAISMVGKFATRDKRNLLLTTATEGIIDLVVKKLILARSGWLTKLVVPFLMKNFSSHFVADNKDKWLAQLFAWVSKRSANGAEADESAEPEEPVEEKAV